MNVLINCPSKLSIIDNKLGGVESLSLALANKLKKKKINVTISSLNKRSLKINNIENIPISIIKKKSKLLNFDTIISSNDARIFNHFPQCKNKILWMHNQLQIEKSIRKKQFLSIIKNKITAVFVSKYLDSITSNLYFFNKRSIINNFLLAEFTFKKFIIRKRKPVFVWSVQRSKGLNDTIKMWIENINSIHPEAKFYILGLDKLPNKLKSEYLKSKSIFHLGRVSKTKLRNIYSQSTAMICLGYDETFCLNALEANSCGLPVISFGKTALNDFIKNNYNGFIVNNFIDIPEKIKFLLKMNNKKRQKLTNDSIQYSKQFSLNNIIYKWLNLLK